LLLNSSLNLRSPERRNHLMSVSSSLEEVGAFLDEIFELEVFCLNQFLGSPYLVILLHRNSLAILFEIE